jgi:hypothetical protein
MPKFTEGEWKAEYWSDNEWIISAYNPNGLFIRVVTERPIESDARLMAQSKKMYEYICDSLGMGKAYTLGEMMERARAILSSIDDE